VSGKAWMIGWMMSGKRRAEKKTPLMIHMGSITALATPLAASVVLKRAETKSPMELKLTAATTQINAMAPMLPRTGTPNAQ
jgi:hypothetical protein